MAGVPAVDVIAVGYGEWLVPALCAWIDSGFERLEPPPNGRVVAAEHGVFLHSGVPRDRSLDEVLPRPDWRLAARAHGREMRRIGYESVRGCPYRCQFCNYPYLFDDSKFRTLSAERIAADWAAYAEQGVEVITCLDSLFTMPKKRLVELCERLVALDLNLRWLGYARTSDLKDKAVVELMKAAGCTQLQIGLESGDPGVLSNMDKYCTVEDNAVGLDTCRDVGITTVTSLIVGYPGETEQTLDNTRAFLAAHPPDFFFLATFSTRVPGVPVLSAENRARFGLRTVDTLRSVSPYWIHDTMSCVDVGNHVRRLQRRLMEDRISLDAALFYDGIMGYDPRHREALLDFQARAIRGGARTRWLLDRLNDRVDRKLARDVENSMGATVAPAPGLRPRAP